MATLTLATGIMMIRHTVHIVSDDAAALRDKLDELVAEGARIVSVFRQPRSATEDSSTSYEDRGEFVVVSQHDLPDS